MLARSTIGLRSCAEPMAREDVEVVGRMVDAWNRADFDSFGELLHPDIEWHDRERFPDAGVHRGREAVLRHLREIAAAVDLVWDVQEAIDGQDGVVVSAILRGQGVGSGARFEEPVYAVAAVRGGQVVRRDSYSTRAEALAAAGLPK